MTLVCLLGGAVREGMERNVWLQLMVMGTFVPRLGAAMPGTMIVADQLGCDAPWLHEDDPVDERGQSLLRLGASGEWRLGVAVHDEGAGDDHRHGMGTCRWPSSAAAACAG